MEDRAVYVGPDHALRDKSALIRPSPDDPNTVLAQFDHTETHFGYGWTAFPRAYFQLRPPIGGREL
jgi:hypothetical protein